MTTYDLTLTPNRVSMGLIANTGLSQSAMTGGAQTIDRGGMKWSAVYSFQNRIAAERAELMSLVAKLRGQANRVRLEIHDNPKRGAYGGTPLVDGASQTGNSLNIDGATPSVTNWIRAGDYFSVIINSEPELKLCTADASSGPGGGVTLNFEPRLRASPANNAVVRVDDGVLTPPAGVFLLSNEENGWSTRPGNLTDLIGDFDLEFVEDLFATQ